MINGGNVMFSWDSIDSVNYNTWTTGNLISEEWGIDDTVSGTGGSITSTVAVTDAENLCFKTNRIDLIAFAAPDLGL